MPLENHPKDFFSEVVALGFHSFHLFLELQACGEVDGGRESLFGLEVELICSWP